MGWLWSTPTPPASSSPTPSSTFPPDQKDNVPLPVPAEAFSKPLSRDEQAEKELASFLQELDADSRPSSTKYSRIGRAPPPATSQPRPPSKEPLGDQLLPTTMSCRDAFDAAFYCNSFGGKFNDLYRYGGVRPCSEHWNKFWFCMRTRQWSSPQKEEAIKDYYKKVESKKYEGGSSEDIWKSREKRVEVGGAFSMQEEDFTGKSDDEWNRLEQQRRADIRRKLGKEDKGTMS
ncbi:Early meiotic induction protein [Lachnellula suecica]|uniref:Early meiotic induction protein n=1 Tax=Lachnellula suecica TaxID=602035 RepID=A0A8T9C7L7_9HELO|nr:Early meiotic induction protein [Lachnellula suecica]